MRGPVEELSDRIAARAGMRLPAWVLEARLADRIVALGLHDPAAYLELIASPQGSRELDVLIEAVRVGETRFFRHRSHVSALADLVIPALLRLRPARVRAWSAGCASGEEAYTLAMLLARHFEDAGSRATIEVVGTDLSDDALAVARARRYPAAALQHVPTDWSRWAFEPEGDGFRVRDRVASLVRFARHNLADSIHPRGFHIIWCRNVLIYFSPEARERVVHRLVDSLEPEGFLFVGYAENLHDFEQVSAVRTHDAVLYQRRPAAPREDPGRKDGWAELPKRPAPGRAGVPDPAARVDDDTKGAALPGEALVQLRGRYTDEVRLSRELSAAIAGPHRRVVVDVDGAEYLCDEAAAVLKRARSAARAADIELTLRALRSGTQRWLRRWGLDGGEP